MSVETADELEMACEPSFMQHTKRVATHRKYSTRFKGMMLVEVKPLHLVPDRSLINDCLSMVFAGILKVFQFEQPVGRRKESDIPRALRKFRIYDVQGSIRNESRIGKPSRLRHAQKIVPI